MNKMALRKNEYVMFPSYIAALNEFYLNGTTLISGLKKNYTWLPLEDFRLSEKALAELKQFAENKTQEFKNYKKTDDPVLTADQIEDKLYISKMMLYTLISVIKQGPFKRFGPIVSKRLINKKIIESWFKNFSEEAPPQIIPQNNTIPENNTVPENKDTKNFTKKIDL